MIKKKFLFTLFISAFMFPSIAFADCFDQCMSIKGCWHKGQTYSNYCGSAEVNCESECERKEGNSARESYGAIAYSLKDGSYGYSNGQGSRGEAEAAALNYCREYSKKCKAMVWFYNSCGAVASNGKKAGWGQDANEYAAQQKALKSCGKKDCEVKVTHCSF